MLIYGPDGATYQQLSYSTTVDQQIFRGPVPAGAVSIEVSLNGGSWTDSPEMVGFGVTEWTVPATGSLTLQMGQNTLQVRPVMVDGSRGSQATATLWRVAQTAERFIPPSAIRAERKPGTVRMVVDVPDDARVRGVYLYGSDVSGGPYGRLNATALRDIQTEQQLVSLSEATVQQALATNPDGSLVAAPTYLSLQIQQQSLAGTPVSTDLSERVVMPNDVATYRVDLAVSQVVERRYVVFEHSRTGTASDNHVPNGLLAGLLPSQPVYYVASLLYWDGTTEQESGFTTEIASSPLEIVLSPGVYPSVSRQQILEDQIQRVLDQQPGLGVQGGSVARDLYLDPFATEVSRIRFLQDFLHRCGSFETLLEIDDPNGQGTVEVSRSNYKQALRDALFLSSDRATQDVIDQAFERLAARYGVNRSTGQHAIGNVTFWTNVRPLSSISFPVGTVVQASTVTCRTLANAVLDANQGVTQYDPATGRYQMTVPARADQPGTVGNLAPNQVRTIVPSVSGVAVTNTSAFEGGLDGWTNRQLAVAAQQRQAGVDTGTLAGIQRWVAETPGVRQYRIVPAQDPLMYRGAAVDVWVQPAGQDLLTDYFALPFGTRRGIVFEPLDTQNLRWRAQDSSLSSEQSLIAFLSSPHGIGLRNITKGLNFDLTGVVVEDYRTIRLSETVPQPPVALTDVVLGDYRVQQSARYVPSRQPVLEVVSLTGTQSGALVPQLIVDQDPQQLGRSNQSSNAIVLSGQSATLQNGTETQVLAGEQWVYLDQLGVESRTLTVTSADGNTTYRGPWEALPDYLVQEGEARSPVAIRRVLTGQIPDGAQVIVTYQAGEQFALQYRVPTVIERVATSIAQNRHIEADIVAKACPRMLLDLTCTVQPEANQNDRSALTRDCQNSLAALLAGLPLGGTADPSEVVEAIKTTTGIRNVQLPLSRMAAGDGSEVLLEEVSSLAVPIDVWSTSTQVVWLLTDALNYATSDGGGATGWRAVYRDQQPLSFGVLGSLQAGQAWIIGNQGAVLPGYSDDSTLRSLLPVGASDLEVAALRQTRTANRVVVASAPLDPPDQHTWHASYVVSGDTGARELVAGPFAYWAPGQVTILFKRGA